MAVYRKSNIIRVTADNDLIDLPRTGLKIKLIRLVGGSDASTAVLRENDTSGDVLYSLKAAANLTDDIYLDGHRMDVSTLHVDLTGTAPEVFIYLE